MRIHRVTKRNPCRICGKPDYCGFTDDFAVCMRVPSEVQTRNGGYLHLFSSKAPAAARRPARITSRSPATRVRQRDEREVSEIFTEFLRRLPLTREHGRDMTRRGLSAVDIALGGYRSNPTALYAAVNCRDMARGGCNFENIPGFFFARGGWHFKTYGLGGCLIPIRNERLHTVALQLRTDAGETWSDGTPAPKYLMVSTADQTGGASSGAPAHFAISGHLDLYSRVRSLIVTEGALKANVIQIFTNEVVVGLCGTNGFDDDFGARLKAAFPSLEKVKLAYDMDRLTNHHVFRALTRLDFTVKKINLKTEILSWNSRYKGFDDFLFSTQTKPQLAA